MTVPLLDVKNLNVTFQMASGDLPVSSDVSFTLEHGKVLGLIGESGSGKTITSKAILGLLPSVGTAKSDFIRYKGRDISDLPPHEFDKLRGADLAMIFQDPVGSFNPVKTIGWHFRAAGRVHPEGHGDIAADAAEALRKVDIADPKTALKKFPHQLSGGMLQRLSLIHI